MKKITLKMLAEVLELDISSVSKALNNKLDIGEDTRDRVNKMAAELGYRPNLLAKSLSQQKTNMLGILVPDISLSFYVKVLRGIFEEAERLAYMPILLISDEKPELEKKNLEFFASLRVDGILINPTQGNNNSELIKNIIGQGIPFVCYDRTIQSLNISAVTNDNVMASYDLTTKLIKLNHRKILYLGPTANLSVAEDRLLGYQKALSDNNILINKDLILDCQLNEIDSFAKVKKLISNGHIPDGIICMGGLVALGAGKAILEAGLKIPEQVLLAEFGDNDIVSKLGVPFISVDQSPFDIGTKAVEVLVSKINGNSDESKPTYIPYYLREY